MPSPFPGMDPYIERPALWPDFHDSLITFIRGALQPLLRPRYVAAKAQDRLFVVESDRPIRPDVAVVRTSSPKSSGGAAIAVMEPDAPAVFELWREEMREPLIQIIEPAAGNRIVTAIEVLSPDNKAAGEGRDSYLKKREEYWASGTNLKVEVDLLRARPAYRAGLSRTHGHAIPVALPRRCHEALALAPGSVCDPAGAPSAAHRNPAGDGRPRRAARPSSGVHALLG